MGDGYVTAVILHVAAPAQDGGLEHVVQSLAIGQHRAGYDVHVAAVLPPGTTDDRFLAPLREASVPVAELRISPRSYLKERRDIARLCEHIGPDVVHTHGYRPDVLDAPVARRQRIATVTTVHGFTGGGWKNRVYERLQLRSFREFDAVVAVSTALGRSLIAGGLGPERVHVVRNAWGDRTGFLDKVAARRLLGVPAEGFRVGWVGRLTSEKGAAVAVEALGHLGDLPVALSVIGAGAESERVRRLVETMGLISRISLHGSVPDAARFFRAFDVFVLTSRTEGTPIVLFEAMAAKVPIVATAVGGVPDVLSCDEAILVAPDDARAVADAVRRVYGERQASDARAVAARIVLSSRFGSDEWLGRYAEVYGQVLGK